MSRERALLSFALRGSAGAALRWALACAVLAGVSAVLLLALSGWFLTGAALAGAAGATVAMAFNYLIPSASIRGLAIIRTVSRYGERLLSHRAALLAMAAWRGRLFGALAAEDSRTAPDFSSGDASARLIGDVEALEDLIIRRPTRPGSLAAAALAVGLVALSGWVAALALALLLGALPLVLGMAARQLTRRPAAEAAEAAGALRAAFIEYAAARSEILGYGAVDRVMAVLNALAARMDRANAALFRGEGLVAGLLAAYGAATAAIILATARGSAPILALSLLAGAAAVEAMAAFARTAMRRATVAKALERLSALTDGAKEPVPAVRDHAPPMPLRIGATELAPGSHVAILGRSGSGKTRLVEALAGMRAAVHPLYVGAVPVDQCAATVLTAQCALSPQDAPMIAGTIADNLRIARPGVDDADMATALHVACLDTRIAAMADGVDTVLDEGGGMLSGGERKRLSLARALLAERPWLLLDEPTEGLDGATEALVVERLGAWLDRTGTGLVLVSHRPAPLVLAQTRISIDALGDAGGDCVVTG